MAKRSVPFYPDCSACGHNVSAVIAEHCTAFVAYPVGDPRGMAGYCGCCCVDDPVVRQWLDTSAGRAAGER
jgi:hypothetical protein